MNKFPAIKPIFAEAIRINSDGGGMAHSIFVIFIFILIGLILWWLGRYFFPKLGAPAIVLTVWDGIFVLIGVIVVINFLAGLAGHQFIQW